MGLDMYLTKKIYVGAYFKHRNVSGSIKVVADGKPVDINFGRISEVTERVGYWRKANQIHGWFVKNVQEGVDDCGEYHVSEDQLKQLLEDCMKVKKDAKLAEQTLPTQSGFFFGGVEYDEYYMQDIDDTIGIIETLFKEKGDAEYFNGDIYYHSSW